MADPLEHATGLEKQEMLAKAAGNDVRTLNVLLSRNTVQEGNQLIYLCMVTVKL